MSTLQEITEAALRLHPSERAALIDTLHGSIDSETAFDSALLNEAAHRADELASGEVPGMSWEESRERLREKFPWLS